LPAFSVCLKERCHTKGGKLNSKYKSKRRPPFKLERALALSLTVTSNGMELIDMELLWSDVHAPLSDALSLMPKPIGICCVGTIVTVTRPGRVSRCIGAIEWGQCPGLA
jgi:hypothetical protein